jgi:hypothetical protein
MIYWDKFGNIIPPEAFGIDPKQFSVARCRPGSVPSRRDEQAVIGARGVRDTCAMLAAILQRVRDARATSAATPRRATVE